MDSDAGGTADLQTDVMRFMAILALCLVAIFALVQSIPQEPTDAEKAKPLEIVTVVKSERRETVREAITPVPQIPEAKKTKPEPIRKVPPAETVVARTEARPPVQPVEPQLREQNLPQPDPAPTDDEDGFTLRFETDLALTQLVAKNEIGLYAISGANALRMTINHDRAEFWSASLPKQYHEMDTATVPESIVSALRMSGGGNTTHARWGVTLPSAMTATLNQYMNEYRGGTLIIGTDGTLRRER